MTRFSLDASARRLDGEDGKVLIGGSPLLMLRLTAAGARLIDRIEGGDDLADLTPGTPAAALLDRLVDAGICHPLGEPGQAPASDALTVIVPAFGRPDALARTLAALSDTASHAAEVIVVDDASPDPESLGHAVANAGSGVRIVRREVNGGPAAARNTGVALSTTPIVAFFDAGCAPAPGWLETLLPHFADSRVAAVAPRISGIGGGDRTAVARYETARSSLDLGPLPAPVRLRSRVPYVPTTALLVRTDALASVGGFDETLRVGEDVDFVWRLHEAGHRVRYEPAATVAHDHPERLRRWAARRIDYGTSAAPLARRHPGNLAPLGVSGWSAGIWAAAAAGHPGAAGAIASGTAADLGRKLRDRHLDHPWREALLLAGRGHLGAGRQMSKALLRAWLPVTVAAALMSRRARRTAMAAIAIPILVEWCRLRPDLDPLRFAALATIDDAAYGLGVWRGVLADGTWEPVIPKLTSWKV